METTLMTLNDIRGALGGRVSIRTLRREMKARRLKAFTLTPGKGSKVYVLKSDFESWLGARIATAG